MKQHLSGLATARVVVIGDLMLDRYWSGNTGRISPEAPVPVVHVKNLQEQVGGAANVAINVSALSGQGVVAGVIGKDEAGDTLGNLLKNIKGMDTELVRTTAPTITKLRVLSRNQQLIRLDFESHAPEHYKFDAAKVLKKHLAKSGALILSDYGKGVLDDPQAIIRIAKEMGKPVLVDPKRNDYQSYAGASLITPNLSEFESVVGPCSDINDIANKAENLMQMHEIEALLVTRSEEGMSLLQRGIEPVHIPAQAREVFDVTGAGDTVIAAMAVAIASGVDWEESARIANVAAGIVVGKLGAATASVPEIRRAIDAMEEQHGGVISEEVLQQAVTDARAHGETVVMTNGCFDILHAGHVRYLEQARRLGDRLIVAVNDDDSVRKLKGAGRPVIPLNERMEVLAGMAAVDWVVSFSEDTPEHLVCQVKPDILVKGGDYKPEQVAGNQCANETKILDFVEGCSTSKIISAIQNKDG